MTPEQRQQARVDLEAIKDIPNISYPGFTLAKHLRLALDELDARDAKDEAMRPLWEELNRQGIIT